MKLFALLLILLSLCSCGPSQTRTYRTSDHSLLIVTMPDGQPYHIGDTIMVSKSTDPYDKWEPCNGCWVNHDTMYSYRNRDSSITLIDYRRVVIDKSN